jgi:hypothetical protein
MLPLACLDGDLKSGASVADLILTMGLNGEFAFSFNFGVVSTSGNILGFATQNNTLQNLTPSEY